MQLYSCNQLHAAPSHDSSPMTSSNSNVALAPCRAHWRWRRAATPRAQAARRRRRWRRWMRAPPATVPAAVPAERRQCTGRSWRRRAAASCTCGCCASTSHTPCCPSCSPTPPTGETQTNTPGECKTEHIPRSVCEHVAPLPAIIPPAGPHLSIFTAPSVSFSVVWQQLGSMSVLRQCTLHQRPSGAMAFGLDNPPSIAACTLSNAELHASSCLVGLQSPFSMAPTPFAYRAQGVH